jgi:hypothetical protein
VEIYNTTGHQSNKEAEIRNPLSKRGLDATSRADKLETIWGLLQKMPHFAD